MTTRIVDDKWKEELNDALAADSSHVRIISPFIKATAIRELLACKPGKLQVITRFNLADFADRVSDVDALRQLIKVGAQVRGIKNLHAKLFVFGSTRAIITSANLTEAGLNRNLEFGVISEDAAAVDVCLDYFAKLWDKARNVGLQEIDGWDDTITRYRLRGGRFNDTAELRDYGADIGFEVPSGSDAAESVDTTKQAFIVFLGRSEYRERAPLDKQIFDEIESRNCHWGIRQRQHPISVQDGAVVFIGRFTRRPNDIRVFGRAIGMGSAYSEHDATDEDLPNNDWRREYPYYIRVHGAEFIAGRLENGVSLNELMRSKGANSFALSKRHAAEGKENPNPRDAYRRKPKVELAAEGHAWLEVRLQDAFETYGKISQRELDTLGWPDPI